MKRLKTLRPTKSARPVKSPKLGRTFAIGILLSLVAVAVLAFVLTYFKTIGPRGTITDPERVAVLDEEFSEFIGSGHNVAEYYYVDSRIGQKLDFGYGPLYELAGYQVIIGRAGAVGAIAYGNYVYGQWHLYPSPASDWSTAFILVFDGCVAPEEWWNRPVLASMLYGVPTTDGRYLPELMVWVPWPDWFDFDNPPTDTTFQAQSWYWNGEQYVQSDFVDDRFPLFSGSQISTTAPERGLSPC